MHSSLLLNKALHKATFLSIALFTLCACTSSVGRDGTFSSLTNRGLLGVSTRSSTVGANLFLSEELENSLNLRRFFEDTGAPIAIEVREGIFSQPELRLFYLPNIYYTAAKAPAPNNQEWILRGPRSVSRDEFNQIRELAIVETGSAVFQVFARETRYEFGGYDRQSQRIAYGSKSQQTSHIEPEIPHIPKKKPAPRKVLTAKDSKHKDSDKQSKPEDSKIKPQVTLPENNKLQLDPKNYMNLNLNQRAILVSQGYAPRNENGDLIHRVKKNTETLTQVAAWYTGNEDNITQVAFANNLAVDATLTTGQVLVIPISLVVQYKQMK